MSIAASTRRILSKSIVAMALLAGFFGSSAYANRPTDPDAIARAQKQVDADVKRLNDDNQAMNNLQSMAATCQGSSCGYIESSIVSMQRIISQDEQALIEAQQRLNNLLNNTGE